MMCKCVAVCRKAATRVAVSILKDDVNPCHNNGYNNTESVETIIVFVDELTSPSEEPMITLKDTNGLY